MIEELETVVLTEDLDEYNLKAGDVGAVVIAHKSGATYEVEFVTYRGDTIAIASVKAHQIRPLQENEVMHARAISP